MKGFRNALGSTLAALLVAACGGTNTETSAVNDSTAHGTLVENPALRIASLDAASFQAQLASSTSGQQLLQVTGDPTCGVDFYYIKFWTVGAAGEATESSGALMVPTGSAAACTGAHPIVLYAHGTQTDKTANIADITNLSNTEGALVAAMFAAQGYIVVAPNYAGYDISTLGYHPFLNASQQSGEMIDALTAARTALPKTFTATADSGKLFVTGYSEGGYVAMATLRALEAGGDPVTAAAPMSGPYALEAFGDAIFYGNVNLGSTVFAPLITTSYQHAYGNIYTSTTDVYSSTYASGIDTLLPSATPIATIFADNLLPETALFDSTTPVVTVPNNPTLSAVLTAALAVPSPTSSPQAAVFDLGFGNPYLVNNDYRVSYALDAAGNPDGAVPTPAAGRPLAATEPTQTLRKALYTNDMRNGQWAPTVPTLLCGGDQDPTVFFSVNTTTMAQFWSGLPAGLLTVLDVGGTPAGPFAAIQTGFQESQAALLAYYESTAGGGLSPAAAAAQLIQNYHTNVAPFCAVAARNFFSQF
ncbi:MAG TPA: prolyl oligopeptidase family serine peptidase [Steroidobacteraceae bacterium]|nr:prolyl oligopeptidase family serine peptidase [Steroidobacteraceae bacterium]